LNFKWLNWKNKLDKITTLICLTHLAVCVDFPIRIFKFSRHYLTHSPMQQMNLKFSNMETGTTGRRRSRCVIRSVLKCLQTNNFFVNLLTSYFYLDFYTIWARIWVSSVETRSWKTIFFIVSFRFVSLMIPFRFVPFLDIQYVFRFVSFL
jgi:hypothetical protein